MHVALPKIKLEPAEITVKTSWDQRVTRAITVHNAGEHTLVLGGVESGVDWIRLPGDMPTSIEARSSAEILLTFVPGQLQEISATAADTSSTAHMDLDTLATAKAVFAACDVDESGELDMGEMVARYGKQAGHMLKEFDLDLDGTISMDELIRVLEDKHAEDAMSTAKWLQFLAAPPNPFGSEGGQGLIKDRTGFLTFHSDDPMQESVDVPVNFTVGAPPKLRTCARITAEVPTLDYVDREMEIYNDGDAPLEIQSLHLGNQAARSWAQVFVKNGSQFVEKTVVSKDAPLRVTVRFQKRPKNANFASELPSDPALPNENFVVPCTLAQGCNNLLHLTPGTEPANCCEKCGSSVAPLLNQIKQGKSTLAHLGALITARCRCHALVTFPEASLVYCPVCLEHVLDPTDALSGPDEVALGYHRKGGEPTGDFGNTGFLEIHSNDPDAPVTIFHRLSPRFCCCALPFIVFLTAFHRGR